RLVGSRWDGPRGRGGDRFSRFRPRLVHHGRGPARERRTVHVVQLEIRRREADLHRHLEDVDVAAAGVGGLAGTGPAGETLSRQVELPDLVVVELAVADPDTPERFGFRIARQLFDDDP